MSYDYFMTLEFGTSIMAENETSEIQTLADGDDPAQLAEWVYHLWSNWADFEIYVINPTLSTIDPPKVIYPEKTEEGDELESVYPIHDFGYKFAASKATEMFTAGGSMCKMYFTIEKMIYLLIERLKENGVQEGQEVFVALGGHERCQRKAFESIINLKFNLVATNYDPGQWGENYLENIKRMADKGYGYPPESPRSNFRYAPDAATKPKSGG